MFDSKVEIGFRLAPPTIVWAARWMTVSTSYSPITRSSTAWSSTSPRARLVSPIRSAWTNSLSGTQSRIRQTTSASRSSKRRTTQLPTRPVAPVTRVGRSRQNEVSVGMGGDKQVTACLPPPCGRTSSLWRYAGVALELVSPRPAAHPGICVVIPCLNEAATIGKVVADFQRALPRATVMVFDNSSTDGSAEKAEAAGAVVVRVPRQGKGYVLRHAFDRVKADLYVVVDADDTYPAAPVGGSDRAGAARRL